MDRAQVLNFFLVLISVTVGTVSSSLGQNSDVDYARQEVNVRVDARFLSKACSDIRGHSQQLGGNSQQCGHLLVRAEEAERKHHEWMNKYHALLDQYQRDIERSARAAQGIASSCSRIQP